jgi:hypothetical protein
LVDAEADGAGVFQGVAPEGRADHLRGEVAERDPVEVRLLGVGGAEQICGEGGLMEFVGVLV